jgi:hypothetical protein
MEEGPEKVLPLIDHVNNIADWRETYWHGVRILGANLGGGAFMMLPFTVVFAAARWLSMLTCKIPVWPKEIEAQCAIDNDDPYLVDWDHLPEGADC